MTISRSDYLNALRAQISEEERDDLERNDLILISGYNRSTVLRLLHEDADADGTVDTERADALRRALEDYLKQYMAEYPQGHKWVILSCLYLALVAGEPMHPQRMTGWRRQGDTYFCRAREDLPGSVCQWCVCRSC